MERIAPTALLPVERRGMSTVSTRVDQKIGLPARRPETRGEFVFLGYGPPSGQWLYNYSGRPVSSREMPGSMVDVYA